MSMIDPTSAALGSSAATMTPGAAAAASADSSGTSSLSDPYTFLQLLVSELQNQNPLDPSDPSQYLTETAQFAMVQQINNMASQTSSALAASLLGRQITGTTASGAPVTGVVSGISISGGAPTLEVGASDVPLADVSSVTSATASSSTGASSPTETSSSTGTSSSTDPTASTTTTPSTTTTTPPVVV